MKIIFLSVFCITFLINCTESIENDVKVDRTNPNIIDLLQETYSDTVFYYTNSDKIIGSIHRPKYFNDDIYFIDNTANRVMAITATGEFKEYVGRTGRGPSEYLKPVSFTIYEDNMVLLDQNLFRISQYKYDDYSNEFKYQKSVIHNNIRMTDVCETNGDIWVYGYKDGNIIHKLSNDLEQVELSGGYLSKYDEDVVREIVRDGYIACTDQYIYSGILLDNTIYINTAADGTLIDTITFDNIVPPIIEKMIHEGREAIAHRSFRGEAYNEKGNFHDLLRNFTVLNNKILAQYARFYQDYRPLNPKITSFVIDPVDHSYRMFHDYPLIYDHKNGSYLTIINDSLSYIVNRVHQP